MVTIISGTNRPGSSTFKLAQYYHKTLAAKGLNASILSLIDLPSDFMVTDMFGKRSQAFQKIQQQVTDTQKFIFIIPEYNGSFPGVLKLFIDGCTFPDSFYDKKAALVGLASGKYGNIRGIEHFTGICNYMHLNVMPLKIHITDIKNELDQNGDLIKPDTIKFTSEQMDKFISF